MNVQKRAKLQVLHFLRQEGLLSVPRPICVIVGFLRSVVDKLDTRINRPLRPSPIQSIPDRHFPKLCTSAFDEIFNAIRVFADRINPRGQAKHAVGINLDDRVVDKDVEMEGLEGVPHVP